MTKTTNSWVISSILVVYVVSLSFYFRISFLPLERIPITIDRNRPSIQLYAKRAIVCDVSYRDADFWNWAIWGGLGGQNGGVVLDDAKVDALVDLIEEQAGQPLLVAVQFQHEVERISKALGYEVPYLGGGITVAKSNTIVDEWNAGKIPVLLAHPSSVAHGLNLQSGGNAVVWFSLTWNAEEFEQLVARVWRQGQTKDCVVHYIVAEGTIDDDVLEALRLKTSVQEALMNSLKRRG